MDEKKLIQQLEKNSKYKVLKKLEPQDSFNEDDGSEKKIAIFLDIESTGTNTEIHEIIELAMIKFEYNSATGKIFRILGEFSEMEQPKGEISNTISELTGITLEMVKDQKINDNDVISFIEDTPLILAHNASFDRRMAEKRFPFFIKKSWGCSMADVDWAENGHFKPSLELLGYRHGFYFDGHRATNDCLASIHLLTQELPISQCLVLNNLILNARKKLYRVIALGNTYNAKDKLKERGYKWNGKFWHVDLEKDFFEDECEFLKHEYGFKSQVDYVDAFNRHSKRV